VRLFQPFCVGLPEFREVRVTQKSEFRGCDQKFKFLALALALGLALGLLRIHPNNEWYLMVSRGVSHVMDVYTCQLQCKKTPCPTAPTPPSSAWFGA